MAVQPPFHVRAQGVAGSFSRVEQGWLWLPHDADAAKPCWCGGSSCPTILHTCAHTSTQLFSLSELVGATATPMGHVQLWYCPPVSSGSGATARLQYKLRKSIVFECSTPTDAEQLVASVRRGGGDEELASGQRGNSWGGCPRVVAVVNPTSGQGRGVGEFSKVVLPMLRDAAGMSVEVHTTTCRGDATRIIQELDFTQVDLILYVGGDGTIFEGLQGLFKRPDWSSAATVPFAAIPTGSGNGMAGSTGLWDVVTAAYSVIKTWHEPHPLDVASILQPATGNRYYLVLSVAYGMMANLDLGTEAMRWMGEARFTVGGVREILMGRTYPLRAAVWPESEPSPVCDSQAVQQHTTQPVITSSFGTSTQLEAPLRQPSLPTRMDDTLTQALLAHEHSSHIDAVPSRTTSVLTAVALATGQSNTSRQESMGTILGGFPAGPPLPILSQMLSLPLHLPASSNELPAGWQMLPERVGNMAQYFMLENTTHLALNARLNPQAQVADGLWELIYTSGLSGFQGKINGAQMLLASDSGSHINLPFVHVDKVRALILEPCAGDTTWLVLDGEETPREHAIYIEVHPRLCRVIAAPSWQDGPSPQ